MAKDHPSPRGISPDLAVRGLGRAVNAATWSVPVDEPAGVALNPRGAGWTDEVLPAWRYITIAARVTSPRSAAANASLIWSNGKEWLTTWCQG